VPDHPAQPSKPAYCETGRPYLRRTSGLGSLVLQLRILAAAVVRVGGTSLMLPSPSRPSENEAKPGDWMEEQTCEQSADLRNAEYAGCDQAQAARATGLLSFALLAATCRS
jgi:hypothetical protein